jgi:hypothetical protein
MRIRVGRCVCLVLVGVLGVALAGCGGSAQRAGSTTATPSVVGSGSASPAAVGVFAASAAPGSVWSHILDQVQPDGQVRLGTALAAFAAAIGPVPGARVPSGAAGPIPSGSLAVSWVLARWAQLSPAQRKAVAADLGTTMASSGRQASSQGDVVPAGLVSFRSGGRQAAAVDPNLACATADSAGAASYRSQVAGITAAIASHIGVPFTIPVYLEANTQEVSVPGGEAAAYTYPCHGVKPFSGSVTGCTVHVEPKFVADTSTSAADIHEVLTHELMHCFLFQQFGLAYNTMPAWYLEGVPTWVETVLAGAGDALTNDPWIHYLNTDSRQLFDRAYDALGFYEHLAETGTDPWTVILPIGRAFLASGNSNVAGWNAAGVTQNFLDSWGSGYTQGRYPGAAWATGAGLWPYQPDLGPVEPVTNTTTRHIGTLPASSTLGQLDVTADVINVDTTSSTSGLLSLGGGAAIHLDQTAGVNFCSLSSSRCDCPTDSNDSDATFTHIDPGTEYIGVTGGLQDGGVTITGNSIDNFCNDICRLMPASTVASIVGHTAGTAHSYGGGVSPRDAICSYDGPDGEIHAELTYLPDDTGLCRHYATVLRGSQGYRPVGNVGDSAGYSRTNGILVFYGTTCIGALNENGVIDQDASESADAALVRALHAKL